MSARSGDREAMGLLLARHRGLLIAVCTRLLGDAGLAEDAAQEATVRALLNLDRLRRPERFGAWLAGIGLNISRMWLRDRWRESWSWEAVHGGRQRDVPAPPEDGPEGRAERADIACRIWAAVEELPPGERSAVLLAYWDGLTQEEAAGVLGTTAGAVKTRLHRARRRLRPALWSVWKEEEMNVTEATRWVEMHLTDVRRAPGGGEVPDKLVVLLKEVGGERGLTIWIGNFEGRAIAMLLRHTESPRPMTYQFTHRLLESAGARLVEARITRLSEGTYFAEAMVDGPQGARTVDARPSDAMALALLAGAPIRVDQAVLEEIQGAERGSPEAFDRERERYREGAAEIARATTREWEAALEHLRKERC